MAEFQLALENTLRFEDSTLAGVVTHDTGGATRFGISENANPDVFPEMITCSRERALELAGQIYRSRYWRFDGVCDQAVANKIFDGAVNEGLHESVRLAQRALGTVVADGLWGQQTLEHVNAADAGALLLGIRKEFEAFYRGLANDNPVKYGRYLAGWLRRNQLC